MSRLRGVETRAIAVPPPYPEEWTIGDVTGTTGWGPGMTWRGNPWGSSTDDAMRLSAVFACLRILSEAISTLPFDTYRRLGGTRRPYRPRPAFLDFVGASRIDYLSQIMLSLLTDGNAYVYVVRDPLGDILTLRVIDPAIVTVQPVNGRTEYRVAGRLVEPLTELLHIKGMSLPGALTGVSPIRYAAETIGLGLSTQRYGKTFFDNGALPGAVIKSPGKFSREAAERFAGMWNDAHGGVGNAHRVGVLTEGADLQTVSINPNDSQFLETRMFTVPDVARIYGVPPHLIADAERSTSWGSGLAEQNMSFGQYTLRGWCERIEEGHTNLLGTLGLTDVFCKLNLDALLRAATSERYAAHAVGIEAGFLLKSEARADEDLPPITGIDDKPVEPVAVTPPPAVPQNKATFGGGA